MQVKAASVRIGGAEHSCVKQYLAVADNPCDVGMMQTDLYGGRVLSAHGGYGNVQLFHVFCQRAAAKTAGEQRINLRNLRIGHMVKHLKYP